MSSNKRHTPSVNDLRPHEQTAVLTTLAQRTDAVGEDVREEIERLLTNVDPESVAREVQLDFELIDADTIFARSGRHRYGYTAPEEAAWQVLEETLEPYLERMKWYHAAGRDEAFDAYALGVLRGLYDVLMTARRSGSSTGPITCARCSAGCSKRGRNTGRTPRSAR